MDKINYLETYQVYVKEIPKTQTLDQIREFLINKIRAHPVAKYIGTFNHYDHTKSVDGDIAEDIIGAIDVLFCFGAKLLDPKVLSVRPRIIGICETDTRFVISFMEAPNPKMTQTISQWVEELSDQQNNQTNKQIK